MKCNVIFYICSVFLDTYNLSLVWFNYKISNYTVVRQQDLFKFTYFRIEVYKGRSKTQLLWDLDFCPLNRPVV